MYKLNDWNISDNGLTADDILQNGNRLLTGNGYLGRRGVVDEALPDDLPATILSGIYDKQGDLWREPINSPDPLYIIVSADGNPLRAGDERTTSHEQALDFRYGCYSRETSWNIQGGIVTVKAQRYAHMEDVHLLCMRYVISADFPCSLSVKQGINCEIKDLNGPHLGDFLFGKDSHGGTETRRHGEVCGEEQGILELSCKTLEQKIPISVFSKFICEEKISKTTSSSSVPSKLSERQHPSVSSVRKNSSAAGLFNDFTIILNGKNEIELFIYGSIYTGLDTDNPVISAKDQVLKAQNEGWDSLLQRHKNCWDEIWRTGDVIIEGDDGTSNYAQRCLRYSLYHLWIIAPRHRDGVINKALSIPARGLSGQTYKGAVFWDTEMFIAPYFLSVRPELAAQFIRYRIQTLPGAKRKAAEYGYRGAFFAWESQESGDDACTDFNVTDVFTGRPVRTYFRDKQIHISGDIVYSIHKYINHTADLSILTEGGMELLLETARFYLSYLYYSPEHKRYEVLDVIGPDEYHERVNNNAFTNKIVFFVFEAAYTYAELLKKHNPSFIYNLIYKLDFENDYEFMNNVLDNIYIPTPDKNGIIEQFDGYFRYENCSLEDVRSRLKDPKEYWGGSGGVASATQIIKQADVVAMLALLGEDYSTEIKKANLDYYEPRTEHGSSLSSCMHALLFCETGQSDSAFPFFVKTSEIDITGKSKQFAGLVYIGGTHPAANGGAWLTIIQGFCGFSVDCGEIKIVPRLPSAWKKVKFTANVCGEEYEITVTKDDYKICKK